MSTALPSSILPKFSGKQEEFPVWEQKLKSYVLINHDFHALLKLKPADVNTTEKWDATTQAIDNFGTKSEKLAALLNLYLPDNYTTFDSLRMGTLLITLKRSEL